ncbi:MAG UNVERIFIED_CONTAM: hypothetical protein LVT10_00185 [Anaerolineae bacterium]
MIDRAPYTAKQALEAQVVDALVTEERLYQHLQSDSLHMGGCRIVVADAPTSPTRRISCQSSRWRA